jgi:hypothetical protein
MLGLGSLESDREGLDGLGDEVQDDMKMNNMLHDKLTGAQGQS